MLLAVDNRPVWRLGLSVLPKAESGLEDFCTHQHVRQSVQRFPGPPTSSGQQADGVIPNVRDPEYKGVAGPPQQRFVALQVAVQQT